VEKEIQGRINLLIRQRNRKTAHTDEHEKIEDRIYSLKNKIKKVKIDITNKQKENNPKIALLELEAKKRAVNKYLENIKDKYSPDGEQLTTQKWIDRIYNKVK